MANKNLTNAKRAKNDEFYTQYGDIQKEIEAYLEYDPNVFRNKTVYCNCDDPFESNFFKYFANKFKEYGLKKLIATSYFGSPISETQLQFPGFEKCDNEKKLPENNKAFRIEINEVVDLTGDGITNLNDVKWLIEHDKNVSSVLHGDDKYAAGDFRSKECIELLKQADIVVTNPPFSLFREYLKQLIEYEKNFLIIGNLNAITYKEVFPLLKENKVWLGESIHSGDREFIVPHYIFKEIGNWRTDENGVHYARVMGVRWFTNLDHGRRHQPLPLMTMDENLKYSKHKEIKGKKMYDRYDNYDAIEVSFTDSIPSDYCGVMGVPISFLDKYNPDQFEIVGSDYNVKDGLLSKLINPKWKGKLDRGYVNNKRLYSRIFIKHKKIKSINS